MENSESKSEYNESDLIMELQEWRDTKLPGESEENFHARKELSDLEIFNKYINNFAYNLLRSYLFYEADGSPKSGMEDAVSSLSGKVALREMQMALARHKIDEEKIRQVNQDFTENYELLKQLFIELRAEGHGRFFLTG